MTFYHVRSRGLRAVEWWTELITIGKLTSRTIERLEKWGGFAARQLVALCDLEPYRKFLLIQRRGKLRWWRVTEANRLYGHTGPRTTTLSRDAGAGNRVFRKLLPLINSQLIYILGWLIALLAFDCSMRIALEAAKRLDSPHTPAPPACHGPRPHTPPWKWLGNHTCWRTPALPARRKSEHLFQAPPAHLHKMDTETHGKDRVVVYLQPAWQVQTEPMQIIGPAI